MPKELAGEWQTANTGQVFSGQRINFSGLNLVGKDLKGYAWDVHSERQVTCADCHYSTGLPHQFEGRKVAAADGRSRRTCQTCHDASSGHDFLENKEAHFGKLACGACHVPHMPMTARQVEDRTLVDASGKSINIWRGLSAEEPTNLTYMEGYEPVLLQTEKGLAPHNLVASWFWMDGDREIALATLKHVMLKDGVYRPEVMQEFDSDGSGSLTKNELRIDTRAKEEFMTARLKNAGATAPRIVAEVTAHPINHGMTPGKYARRTCEHCHAENREEVKLAPFVPGGVVPEFGPGKLQHLDDGSLVFERTGSIVSALDAVVSESKE